MYFETSSDEYINVDHIRKLEVMTLKNKMYAVVARLLNDDERYFLYCNPDFFAAKKAVDVILALPHRYDTYFMSTERIHSEIKRQKELEECSETPA